MNSKKINADIYILGGGPAGMASAYYAHNQGASFHLFESTDQIGGNCKTLQYKDFYFDTGAHRFHDKNKRVTEVVMNLLGDRLKKVESPSKIFRDNQFIEFPIRLRDVLSKLDSDVSRKIILENILNQFKGKGKIDNFKDLAYSNYGETLAELFLINYTEKLWGCSPDELSLEVSGGRLKHLNIYSVLMKALFRNNIKSKHLDGSFLYPEYGFGTIFEEIKNIIGRESISFNSPIINLFHEDNRIKNIMLNNSVSIKVNSGNSVVSTLSLPILIKGMYPRPPSEIYDIVNSFQYRGLRLCIFFINKDYFSSNASIYFPQPEFPFTRIYEPKNRSSKMAPKGKTCIVVEIPFAMSSGLNCSAQDSLAMVESILIKKGFIEKDDVEGCKSIDIPYAYPVIKKDTGNELHKVFNYLSRFENLHLIGRSADFKYSHVHDLFESANSIINKLNNC